MTHRVPADAKSADSAISEGASAFDDEATPGDAAREEVVHNPAELMRLSAMTTRLLEEARTTALDAAGFRQMARIHGRAMGMVERSLSSGLRSELLALAPPFDEHASEAELRVAQAQLVGWLDGLMVSVEAAMLEPVAAAPLPEPRGALPGDHAYL